MWIYELTPSVPDVFGISNLDDGSSPGTMAGIIGPSLTPSASAIYFTVVEGGNYYVQCDVTAVNSPWTIDSNIIHPSGGVSSYSPTAACATFIGTGTQQATFTPGTDPGGFGNYVTNAQTFIDAATLSVTPNSLAFVNRIFGFSSAIGDGVGQDGTCYSQNLNVTASGAWTVTSDSWLLCTPSSGSGNGTVKVQLLDNSLPKDSFLRVQSTGAGAYSGTVVITPAIGSPVTVPVSYRVGYGGQLGG
jgi:hypothetical protein